MAEIDLSGVSLFTTYRVGYLPPTVGALSPGELYVEVAPPGGGVPRLWVGTVPASGQPGNAALLVPAFTGEPSAIAIDSIDNPSPSATVKIVGTVEPGAEIELAALTGTDHLTQVNAWSPWDASAGTFDVTWWLAPGDNYRVRVRLRDNPTTFADSNLFAVTP